MKCHPVVWEVVQVYPASVMNTDAVYLSGATCRVQHAEHAVRWQTVHA